MEFTTTRPYPQTGLNTAGWGEIAPEQVVYDTLTLTQRGVWLEPLLSGALRKGSDAYPLIVAFEGKLYVEDGHTRIARAVLQGHLEGQVRVFRRAITRPDQAEWHTDASSDGFQRAEWRTESDIGT